MTNPVMIIPSVLPTRCGLGKTTQPGGRARARTLEPVHLRASQINGCGGCGVKRARMAKKLGETDEQLFTVTA